MSSAEEHIRNETNNRIIQRRVLKYLINSICKTRKRKIILLLLPTLFFSVARVVSPDIISHAQISLDLEIKEPPGVIFNRLKDVAGDANGNIYALDRKELVIYVFNAEGRFLKKIGRPGEGPGEFRRPCSIFIDSNDLIYVLDELSRRVEIFDKEANCVRSIKIINFPSGSSKNVIVDKNGNLYISGFYKTTGAAYLLAKFSSTGDFLKHIPLPMEEYKGIELNENDNEMVTAYLSGGSMCIDKQERLYFSHAWPYLIERVTNNSNEIDQCARKNDFNWTPIIFKTDRINGMLFSDFTQTKKIFPLDSQFIINSLFVIDWQGDPRKQIQMSSFSINPEKYIKVLERSTILDIYTSEMEFLASTKIDEKVEILSSDKQGRLLGIKYDVNDMQSIVRFNIKIMKNSH